MSQESGLNERARIAILISGRGSNIAKELGLETLIVERRGRPRVEHDREVVVALQARDIDLVCLAGYMRVLTREFIDAYRGRILNIHPSLLPSFPGLDAQHQALDYAATTSGCTVHFVDETLDGGPIIAQREVPVYEDDTVESLSARILIEEHKLYPEAVGLVMGKIGGSSEVC